MNKKKILYIQEVYRKLNNNVLEIPTLLVIGPQSSGKSSVLDRIIGYDILPRGNNLVTRCPVIIHLQSGSQPHAYFDQDRSRKYELENVCSEIHRRTAIVCGEGKNISLNPIVVTIITKNALEMTLIDLPGLTKVPIDDQPVDIEEQVESIVLKYASVPTSIILAVINANVDIANSESLKIAKRVDPEGVRTLGIVTKIDIMDKGTDCLDILKNVINPLALGYIGVINRSQVEQNEGMSLDNHSKKEQEFYKTTIYKDILPNIGSDYLIKKIHELYSKKVEQSIDPIRNKLTKVIAEKQNALSHFNRCTISINSVIMDYYGCIQKIVSNKKYEGIFQYNNTNILYEFYNIFNYTEFPYDFSGLENIHNSNYLFICEDVLFDIIKKNFQLMLEEMMEKIDTLVKLLKSKINTIRSEVMKDTARYLNNNMVSIIDARHEELLKNLRMYIDVQGSYINVNRSDFDFTGVISAECKNIKEGGNKLKFEIIRVLSTKYLDISKSEILNFIVKSVHYFFIRYIEDGLLPDISKVQESYIAGELDLLKRIMKIKEEELSQFKDCLKILEEFVE